LALCFLFALGTILHVAQAMPAHSHAPAFQIAAAGEGSAPCESGHAAGNHCQPTSGCAFCTPVGAAAAPSASATARPPIAAAALLAGGMVFRHFHPPRRPLHA
jgi:hypothetical protein